MKTVILAGGLGSRLAEETEIIPKPMIEIGGRPIIWHIMKIFAHHNLREFIIALGYKGEVIKRYFYDYLYSLVILYFLYSLYYRVILCYYRFCFNNPHSKRRRQSLFNR